MAIMIRAAIDAVPPRLAVNPELDIDSYASEIAPSSTWRPASTPDTRVWRCLQRDRRPRLDSFGAMVSSVAIRGEMIRLGQLLKLAGVIESGAEVKSFLSSETVWVNGEREVRRGRQLHVGDIVRVGEHELRLTSA
jgi:ribosome-associated protein